MGNSGAPEAIELGRQDPLPVHHELGAAPDSKPRGTLPSPAAPWGNMASKKMPSRRSGSMQKLEIGHLELIEGPEGIWPENQLCWTQVEVVSAQTLGALLSVHSHVPQCLMTSLFRAQFLCFAR